MDSCSFGPKNIILCADDFAYNEAISEALLKLAQAKRLSALSCMVNRPAFAFYATELLKCSPSVQIGLHFNITEGHFLSQPSKSCFNLSKLLFKTHVRSLSPSFIEQEFIAQLDYFIQMMGRWPDFIDGHQHVHQFPLIRALLIKYATQQLEKQSFWIRSTYPLLSLPAYDWKGRVLAYTGGKALKESLIKHQLPHNAYFAGVYDFSPRANYSSLFKQWLRLAQPNTLIMCHPGKGHDATDAISAARLQEMAYFSSEEFVEDCGAHQVSF